MRSPPHLGKAAHISALTVLWLATSPTPPVVAQTGAVVQGRVIEAGATLSITNAVVELEGHGVALTSSNGVFRFEGVEPGGYPFRVVAFGYAPHAQFLVVEGDQTISVSLDIAPLSLDSLAVQARLIEVEGRVRDPDNDFFVVGADVLTNQGRGVQTDAHGRFRMDAFEHVPLQVSVRAFGYLPQDSVLVPTEDESFVFELEPDPVALALIDVQVERLEERAEGRRSVLMRPMNRESLLRRHAGRRTLAGVLEWDYERYLGRVNCVVIDEEQLLGAWEPSSLFHILPEELERIEFLAFGPRSEAIMVRIYTRDFIQEMTSRQIPLRTPVYFGFSRPPMCL